MSLDILDHDLSHRIYFTRRQRVMLDSDLAALYGVETGALNRAVKRNKIRFPEDFMFQLSEVESESLRCQFGISNDQEGRGGRRYLPLVFTEQGVAMLSSVLKSKKAALVNIEIMRAFVKLREFLLTNQELARKLNELEKKYDARFSEVFDAIHNLMKPVEITQRKIGI